MKLKNLSTRNLLILFSACSLISLIVVTPNLSNYSEFYKAIDSVHFALDNITMNATQLSGGIVHITVEFNVTNPTGFDGMQIPTVTCHLRYFNDNHLSSLMGITKSISPPAQLRPSQSTVVKIDFIIEYYGQQQELVRIFLGYLQLHPKQVQWLVTGQYALEAYSHTLVMQIEPAAHATATGL